MAKMTYAVAIDEAIRALGEGEAVDRLVDLKVQLAKRNSAGKRGLTKVQKENLTLIENIAKLLADGDLTATEASDILGVTCQKVSPQLSKLVKAGRVERVKDGKVVRFHLVEA